MKHLVTNLIAFIVATSFTLAAYDGVTLTKKSYQLNMVKIARSYDDYYVNDSPLGNRVPARPIPCYLNEDDIELSDVEISDIISFEIYSLDGSCVMSVDNYRCFISSLEELRGEYEIKFLVDDYIFKGYIEM